MNVAEHEAGADTEQWTEQDIAVVALEMSREFRRVRVKTIARAVGVAAARVSVRDGRTQLANTARRLLSSGPAKPGATSDAA